MHAAIRSIEYHLPERVLGNAELAALYPTWTAERIEKKLGIAERRIAAEDECSSDLAVAAALKLFASGAAKPADIDFILLCTQSPDYFLPTTACLVQHRLGIPTTAGALDFNLGCSGYVYGLSLAKGLIETGQAKTVLLITAETYSKFIHPLDKTVRTLFGDAASATLLTAGEEGPMGPFVFGTDGEGAENLIVPRGGMRDRGSIPAAENAPAETVTDESDDFRTADNLYMNGPEIFTFSLRAVPRLIDQVLERAGLAQGDVDSFMLHQANFYMLDHLRRKMGIPENKFWIGMRDCGNTVSSTIPIALRQAADAGFIRNGHRILLAGFGVGYSWAGAMIRWTA